jgi:hypothetical protein
MTRSVVLAMALVVGACRQHAPAPEGPADHDPPPTPVSPATTPFPSLSETPAATPGRPECRKPIVVSPRALATGWPSLLGERTRLRVIPVRAIGMTEWLVMAGGQRFIVVAAPDTSWNVDHAFVVVGSTIAPLHGRTALPELMLDDGCES